MAQQVETINKGSPHRGSIAAMYRVLRLLGLLVLCFSLASGSVLLIIFWDAITWHVFPRQPAPRKPRIVVAPPPAAQTISNFVPPEPPPRKGRNPWSEVEKWFDEMRARRDEHPAWKDNPSAVYEMVANPAFTDSANILDHYAVDDFHCLLDSELFLPEIRQHRRR